MIEEGQTKVTNQTSLVDDENSYNVERIEDIVKASDLLNENTSSEEKSSNSESSNTNSLLKRLFYPFYAQLPEFEEYQFEGKVIDIKFNDEFEQELEQKNIIQLSNEHNYPSKIFMSISVSNLDNPFTREIDVEENRDELEQLLNYYGDGNLDSLIGANIILEPSRNKYGDKYNVVIPDNKATTKIKLKLKEISMEYLPTTKEKYGLRRFFIGNIVRFALTMSNLAILYSFTILPQARPASASDGEFIEAVLVLTLIMLMVTYVLWVFSTAINKKVAGGNTFVGAFELAILTYFKDGFKKVSSVGSSVNKWIGEQI